MSIDVGDKFHCWTVIGFPYASLNNYKKVEVQCDCNNVSVVRSADLKAARTKMCKSCAAKASAKGHGGATKGSVTSEYVSYTHMIQRCTNPNDKDYANYGGRGITICDMWRTSYEAFFMSMGKKPDSTYTIERLDGNKGYEPSNCIWASKVTQNRNKGDTVFATIDGVTKNVSEWILDLGLTENSDAVYKRISRGMHPAEALTRHIVSRKKQDDSQEA